MLLNVMNVALGGAIGATCRYLAGLGVMRLMGPTPFPLGVLGVNILGSGLMGVFVVLAAHKGLTPMAPFVMTGVLGGFTTFSAFSLEAVTLIERGAIGHAALYIGLSVGLSIAALALGMMAARGVLT
ncbi:fluoride efflux transporter CrcB [Tritonibacter scottomollicae]|uniref:Fluoride-specific ion channel FluC n=1 Tax=Tritonibacter scottomollicae TaxID=483013 RepID=A0A2T1A980_TRISK|nr:fluoride efflux transporter CrcB [Tritonibacter scottomollicae]PRZ45162.1 camphor resistance protein CrcB [Tritonibacter scottomollicae]